MHGLSEKFRRIFLLLVAVVLSLCVAKVYGYFRLAQTDFSSANFCSYFTIQSNALTILFLIYAALQRPRSDGHPSLRREDQVRAGLLLYMGITTSVYWIALHRFIHIPDASVQQANMALHYLAFATLLIDHAWRRPHTLLTERFVLQLLIYPLLYGVYIFVRGAFIAWYPYPFMDVTKLGYPLAVGLTIGNGILYFAAAYFLRFCYNRWLRSDS